MKNLKKEFAKTAQKIMDRFTGNGLMQEENREHTNMGGVSPEMSAAARQCAAEGCVLLKNSGALPLEPNKAVAVFGRCQLDWFYVGYGSGGDVKSPYYVNLIEGLRNAGQPVDTQVAQAYDSWCHTEENEADHGWWGHWPMSHPEMPLDVQLVAGAAQRCDTALVVIGRAAGEDRENTLTPGSYYLKEDEFAMLDAVTAAFRQTVVILNAGNILDMSWLGRYGERISGILFAWLGGMESGNGVADVLTGKVSPCGRLADTIACSYEDYPSSACFGGKKYNEYAEDIFVGYRYFQTFAKDQMLYPFGFGLSYTTFRQKLLSLSVEKGQCAVRVSNAGPRAGKEVVLLYCQAPQGRLGKAERVLVAYGKTGLLEPGADEAVTLRFDREALASYDDTGASGIKEAFVLEAGTYNFYLGDRQVAQWELEATQCLRRCERACGAQKSFRRLVARQTDGGIRGQWEAVPVSKVDLRRRILANLPKEVFCTGDRGYKLGDVASGKVSMDDFLAQLSLEELEALTRGEGKMNTALGVPGNAGAFGGVIQSLRDKGVGPAITADGPAGLRLQRLCGLLPCGTAQACTFNDALVEEIYAHVGRQMRELKVDVHLAPGLNIHRNPLCGRNFEYFSEDPLLTGKMAAAVVRGVQSQGGSSCPKHFAGNNQEVRRNRNDSRISGRALREIYLRGFEICVKESKPHTIMTSYNKINGVWSHYNYDLVTTILRKEWGFDGVVMTDWWMQRSRSPEFPKLRNNAYRVRAQVDVLMPGNLGRIEDGYAVDGSLLKTVDKADGLTRAELQRTARTVLEYIIKIGKAY